MDAHGKLNRPGCCGSGLRMSDAVGIFWRKGYAALRVSVFLQWSTTKGAPWPAGEELRQTLTTQERDFMATNHGVYH